MSKVDGAYFDDGKVRNDHVVLSVNFVPNGPQFAIFLLPQLPSEESFFYPFYFCSAFSSVGVIVQMGSLTNHYSHERKKKYNNGTKEEELVAPAECLCR